MVHHKIWIKYGIAATLPRGGLPTKVNDMVRRALAREATNRLRIDLKALERSTAQMG